MNGLFTFTLPETNNSHLKIDWLENNFRGKLLVLGSI